MRKTEIVWVKGIVDYSRGGSSGAIEYKLAEIIFVGFLQLLVDIVVVIVLVVETLAIGKILRMIP